MSDWLSGGSSDRSRDCIIMATIGQGGVARGSPLLRIFDPDLATVIPVSPLGRASRGEGMGAGGGGVTEGGLRGRDRE